MFSGYHDTWVEGTDGIGIDVCQTGDDIGMSNGEVFGLFACSFQSLADSAQKVSVPGQFPFQVEQGDHVTCRFYLAF